MIKLAPSILSADFAELGKNIERIDKAGCDWIHIDVMDGIFVPNISIGIPVIRDIRRCTHKYFDVHLMIAEPVRYIKALKEAGADMLTVHVEACKDVEKTINVIHSEGLDVGVACNPETAVADILPYLDKVEMILIMTVHPGFGGQSYIDVCTEKIKTVRRIIDNRHLKTRIEADGGINLSNVTEPLAAGADVIVAGSAIYRGDVEKNIDQFKKAFLRYE